MRSKKSASFSLPVECFHQQSPDTCLAACVRMVSYYFGAKLDELKFYKESQFGPDYPGLCDVCIALPLIKRGFEVFSYWDGNLDDWGVWTDDLARLYREHEKKALKTGRYFRKRHASFSTIRRFLKKGVPVIVEVLAGKFYRTNEIGTHMILVRGFSDSGFFICDPWGLQHFISYDHFLKAWRPSEKFGGSMIVVAPISKSKFPVRPDV